MSLLHNLMNEICVQFKSASKISSSEQKFSFDFITLTFHQTTGNQILAKKRLQDIYVG